MTKVAQNIGLDAAAPFIAGDSFTLECTATDAAGAALNLTGVQTLRWQAFPAAITGIPTSSTPIISKAIGSGVTIINATSGRFDVALVPADTSALEGAFYHECEVVDAASKVSTLFIGRMLITKGYIV